MSMRTGSYLCLVRRTCPINQLIKLYVALLNADFSGRGAVSACELVCKLHIYCVPISL